MKLEDLRPEIRSAVAAAQEKHAADITVLRLSDAFADYFLLCSGHSTPQLAAIAEAVEEDLSRLGARLTHREGRHGAEWLLLDYTDFVVHIFSDSARRYYDLERLWRSSERLDISSPDGAHAPHLDAEGDRNHA